MLGTIKNIVGSALRTGHWFGSALCLLLMVSIAVPAQGWMDTKSDILEMGYNPNGVFVLDGSFVMNVGEVQINITNFGLIGSAYSTARPWSDAPSCQWPSGSGNEYLWASGLWVGGIVLGERLCSTGGNNGLNEFAPLPDALEFTIYEASATKILRPSGNPDASGRREPEPAFDDDDDGLVDEEVLNGKDDDGDGKIDEDFGQIGNQMFVLTNYDNTRLSIESFPDHTPMNLEMIQTSFQWENDQVDDFVGFDYTINNVGVTEIEDVYIGFYSDSDISPRGEGGGADDDMAGSWPANHGSPGLVRASDGSFVPIQVGFMWDAAEEGRLDGYFGIVFLGHDVDPAGILAPKSVGMRTFQKFSGRASFEQGGDPTNDEERYILLSSEVEDWDNDTLPGKQDDFRFLVSAGPFALLPPGESLTFQVGMVVGPGLGSEAGGQGLLAHCAEAFLTWDGIWLDKITQVQPNDGSPSFNPGLLGRETMLCKKDFPAGLFDTFVPDYMDPTCLDSEWLIGQPRLLPSDLFDFEVDGETTECAMFNMDNCFECNRQNGFVCEPEDFMSPSKWTCNEDDPLNPAACTGINGLETQIHWLVGMAPPPPGLRLWSTDSKVHVYWEDSPEYSNDIRLRVVDFESYRIWRADNWDRPFGSSLVNGPESALWQMVGEYDLVNTFLTQVRVDGVTIEDTLPLGANTGLEVISYTPPTLSDPLFDGLAEAMQEVVDNDPQGTLKVRPEIRNTDGIVIPKYQGLVRWETYPDALDTFFAVAAREADPANGVKAKRGSKFYEYVDRDIHNGFIYFYSVTSTDHELKRFSNRDDDDPADVVGPGLVGDPGSSFSSTVPGTEAQTAEDREEFGVNIYVYPNPATREALAEYQELNPNGDDPTGVRVTFTNLPKAKNMIQIYTVSGDLVQTISHSGLDGTGHVSWNLMSRNGQEIVSGVYLYTVQSDDSRFDDFVGKFVVVR